ncbi:DUF4160 domain-containing protein [Flectobacillus sp. DC10W]|uniref:DUF4160 domain-containing protein n=1 Tax=Flectobacillus longus TaxID=2984207 RepID=A0ABT6YRJ6_9BACT|nr:DUF4160 domain-containing protein [Flectobacillus longus]MDI9866210.1 DUF4160 domain-containing protein [Flectobacillus longus]
MPLYEFLDGIRIYLYFNDHLPPHFHALYGEYEILIDIRLCSVHKGDFPIKQLKKVIQFAKENQEELLELFFQFNPNTRRHE